jgi:hypothetical protein
MLTQIAYLNFSIGEIFYPTKCFEEAYSIDFRRSVIYGLGVLKTSFQYRLKKWNMLNSRIFDINGSKLEY